jgi:hypothetical protein
MPGYPIPELADGLWTDTSRADRVDWRRGEHPPIRPPRACHPFRCRRRSCAMTIRDSYGRCFENCLKSSDEAINFFTFSAFSLFL